MHIHFATQQFDPAAWHGQAQMLRFLCDGLDSAGHTLSITHQHTTTPTPRHVFSTYEASSGWREAACLEARAAPDTGLWDPDLVSWAKAMLESHGVDVVYAQGGGTVLDIVQAAAEAGTRSVYHVHDYDLICNRQFLLDHERQPCSGPDSVAKCLTCVSHRYSWRARAVSSLTRIPGMLRHVPRPLQATLSRYAYHEMIAHDLARARATASSVDRFIATGQPVVDVLARFGVPGDRIAVLPHVVTRAELAAEPAPTIRAPGPVRIGYFGRLSPEKGVDMLARALAAVSADRSFPFEWHVICQGSADIVGDMIRTYRLDGSAVKHVQPRDGAAIATALRAIDIAVFPSPWPEIGPLALLECLRQGVVCVASDSIGMAAAIEAGFSGHVFPAADEPRLLEALRLATTHPVVRGHAPRQPFLPAPDHEAYFRRLTDILAGGDFPAGAVPLRSADPVTRHRET